MQLSESAFKTRGQLRLVSQKSRRENSHKADVKEIKRLYREGYPLARIGTRSGSALHSPHHGNRLKTATEATVVRTVLIVAWSFTTWTPRAPHAAVRARTPPSRLRLS